jgi:hypothetical protein
MNLLHCFSRLPGILLLIGAVVAPGAPRAQSLPETVLIDIAQSYEYRRPSLMGYVPIEGYELPVREYVEDMMFAAGIEPLYPGDEGAQAVIRIDLRGRAAGGTYLEPTKAYLYTGADIAGEIEVSGPGDILETGDFAATIQRPFRVTINLGFEDPSNAPFLPALEQAGGFIEELCYVMADAWGVEAILPSLFEHEASIRAGTATALGTIGDPAAVPHLLDALYDENERVRWETAWSLGRIGDPAAVPELIDALLDESQDVRWFASWSLRNITGEDFGLDHALWSDWLAGQTDIAG